MKQKLYKFIVVLIAIITVPSVITLILSSKGKKEQLKEKDRIYITVSDGGVDNVYPLNTYIMMAMAADIPSSYEIEALKAQATMIRTYIYVVASREKSYRLNAKDIGLQYQSYDQLYKSTDKDENEVLRKLKKAVEETNNTVVVYEDSLIIPLFHPVSVGMTRSASQAINEDIPYLISVESKGDVQSNDYMNITSLSKEKVVEIIKREYPDTKIEEETILDLITIDKRDEDGYIESMSIGQIHSTGEEFASIFGLNSTHFYMETFEDSIRFICKGKGHGLGLSQFGANLKALQGYQYDEILEYYFTGTKVIEYDLSELIK